MMLALLLCYCLFTSSVSHLVLFGVRRPLCPVALCGRVTLSSVCVMVSVECILGTVQHDPGAFPSVIVPDTHPGTLWFLTSTRSQHRFGLFVFCRVVGPSEQQNRNGAAGDLNSVRPLVSQISFFYFSPLMSPVYSVFPFVSAFFGLPPALGSSSGFFSCFPLLAFSSALLFVVSFRRDFPF